MSGRVTRKKNRRRNSDFHDWALVSASESPTCLDLRHEKELANIYARMVLFGPFDEELIIDCGCRVFLMPLCQFPHE